MLQITRINSIGLVYLLQEMPGNRTKIILQCKQRDNEIIVNVDIEELSQRWYDWQHNGRNIQIALQPLSPAEREFLITGITDSEWKEIFANEENETEADETGI